MHGALYTDNNHPFNYSITENDHYFYKKEGVVYRTNKIYKITRKEPGGFILSKELVTINDSKVIYEVDETRIRAF